MSENTSKLQLEAVDSMIAAQGRYLTAFAIFAVTASVFVLTWGTSGVFYGYILLSLIFAPILFAAVQFHRNARAKLALHNLAVTTEKAEEEAKEEAKEPEEEMFRVYGLL